MKNLVITVMFLISFAALAQKEEIPFANAQKVPAYPGCENMSGKELKKCTTEKITSFVNANFDTSLGKKLGITGMTKIVVQFKIEKDGTVTNVHARSLADKADVREKLQEEATRVVSSMPKMQPGQFQDKDVAIMYSLPIQFAVPGESEKN